MRRTNIAEVCDTCFMGHEIVIVDSGLRQTEREDISDVNETMSLIAQFQTGYKDQARICRRSDNRDLSVGSTPMERVNSS